MLNILRRLRKLLFKNKKGHEYVVVIKEPLNDTGYATEVFEFKNAKEANDYTENYK